VIVQPGQYDYETVVRLTAVPAEGYVFSGWSGDVTSEENPIEVEIKSEINLTLNLNQSDVIVLKTQVEIEYDPSVSMHSAWAGHGYMSVASTIHYTNELNHFIFSAGQATFLDRNPYNALEVNPSPSATFILGENGWGLHNLDYEVSTWGIRNYDREENFLVIGDGNEIGEGGNWKGDIYLGEINNDITWTKVTQNQEDMGYFHGVSIGDLDNDGLLDIAALPDWHFFKNKGGGNFEKLNVNYTETNEVPDLYHMYPLFQGGGPTENSPFYCGAGFEIHISDLDEDGVNEIIQSNYGSGEVWRDEEWQSICGLNYRVEVFKLNGEKFDVAWRSDSDEDFFPKDIGGATRIRSFDMDNDGIKDIIIAREGNFGHTIEIWKGKGDLEFEPHSLYNSKDYQFIFREFEVMDVNKDGYLDVVLYSNGWGNINGENSLFSGYFLNPNNDKEGIKLNNFILINDGRGYIAPYSGKELIVKDVYPEKLTPFMKDDRLHFFGSYIASRDYSEFINNFYNQEKNSVKPILWDISVDIK
jgi:hypothetical protein